MKNRKPIIPPQVADAVAGLLERWITQVKVTPKPRTTMRLAPETRWIKDAAGPLAEQRKIAPWQAETALAGAYAELIEGISKAVSPEEALKALATVPEITITLRLTLSPMDWMYVAIAASNCGMELEDYVSERIDFDRVVDDGNGVHHES